MSDDDTLAADSAPPAAQTLSLDVGSLFAERYRVEAVLGRGAMGAVYRVFDEKLGERVALKLLTLDGHDAQARFVDEVRLARRVTHPNVARTHDVGDAGGARFLTMEYVEGVALDRLLAEEGPLSAARWCRSASPSPTGSEPPTPRGSCTAI